MTVTETTTKSKGKGLLTAVRPDWVINWQDGSEQWFSDLADAMYALKHNGEASPTIAEALAQRSNAADMPQWDMRRNLITGRFIGGGRGE
jgi:hypothetical protein